jgi:hypothetical protein
VPLKTRSRAGAAEGTARRRGWSHGAGRVLVVGGFGTRMAAAGSASAAGSDGVVIGQSAIPAASSRHHVATGCVNNRHGIASGRGVWESRPDMSLSLVRRERSPSSAVTNCLVGTRRASGRSKALSGDRQAGLGSGILAGASAAEGPSLASTSRTARRPGGHLYRHQKSVAGCRSR